MDKFLKIGTFLLAAPMLIFPVLHFVYAAFVADIIPPWIPWHLFWNYFTAVTIFVGGLSIIFRKFSYLVALLLGIEIFLFVMLIHIFLLFHGKGDAWAERATFGEFPSRVINALKDFGLSGAVFIFAGTQSESWKETGKDGVFVFGRTIVGLSIAALGIIHFIYPVFAPGLPPMLNTVPFIFPAEGFWVYLTGAALAIIGILIFVGKASHQLVAWSGLILLLFDLLVWLPQFIVHPSDLTGNWLKDLGIIGGVLILAQSLPKKRKETVLI